jgi:histidine triad (HIT) family protein
MEEQCIFCSIKDGKVPSYKVYEDEYVFAALDIRPANPGHLIIVPKKHHQILTQLDVNEMAQLFNVARTLIPVLIKATGAQGANILYSAGAVAGQRSPHAFLNLIPRFENDEVVLTWKPKELSESDFKDMQDKLIKTLSELGGQTQPSPPPPQPPKEEKKEEVYNMDSRPPKYW